MIRKIDVFQFYRSILLKYAKSIYGKDVVILREITANTKHFFAYFEKKNISNNKLKGTINSKEIFDSFIADNQEDNVAWNFEKDQIEESLVLTSDNVIQ